MLCQYKEDSKEYKVLYDRVKAGCSSQSRQIDKTKIGENVKTLATVCTRFQSINKEDSLEEMEKKMFYNSILAEKKPYFFRYKYNTLNKQINAHVKKYEEICQLKFGFGLKELLEKEKKSKEKNSEIKLEQNEELVLLYYRRYMPVLESPCVMNKVCYYIESVDFGIKQKVRTSHDFDYKTLMTPNFSINNKIYKKIAQIVDEEFKRWQSEDKVKLQELKDKNTTSSVQNTRKVEKDMRCEVLRNRLLEEVTSNEEQLTNHLVYLFYVDRPSYSNTTLWTLVGKQIFETIKKNVDYYYFPIKNKNGNLTYLYDNYMIERIKVNKEMEEFENEVCDNKCNDTYMDSDSLAY